MPSNNQILKIAYKGSELFNTMPKEELWLLTQYLDIRKQGIEHQMAVSMMLAYEESKSKPKET